MNNNYIVHLILFIAFIFFTPDIGLSQDRILEPGYRPILVGGFLGINYNMHGGKFSIIESDISCFDFDKGNGFGPNFGVKSFIPLNNEFNFSPRLSFEGRGGKFTQNQAQVILGSNNKIESIELEDKLEVTLNMIIVDILICYYLDLFGVYLTAGPSLGYLIKNQSTLEETILAPVEAAYLNGLNSKEIFQSEMNNIKSIHYSVKAGVGLLYELSQSLYFNPEVLYIYPLNKTYKTGDNTINSFQITIGVLIEL